MYLKPDLLHLIPLTKPLDQSVQLNEHGKLAYTSSLSQYSGKKKKTNIQIIELKFNFVIYIYILD